VRYRLRLAPGLAVVAAGLAGYSGIYCEQLQRRAGGFAKERLAAAALEAGNSWLTTWTGAGRPELR
jgi:hypothetical protein